MAPPRIPDDRARRPGPTTMPDRQPHPHFDDRGTLHWHTRLAEAQAQAHAEGKRIFIEFGREL